MIINNNNVEQINVALLDIDKRLSSITLDSSALKTLEATVDGIRRSLNETKSGLTTGETYNINITGNASSASYATTAGTAETATTAETAINANHADTADTATTAIATKLSNALTVNGKTYNGSVAVDAGVQTVANGGTGATTAKGAFMNLANGLQNASNPGDTECMIYKNTDGTNWGLYTLSQFWDYIKGKISTKLVIPIGAPSQLEDGCIWIER